MLLIVIPSSNGVGHCDDEDIDTLIQRWDRPAFRAFAICHGLAIACMLLFVRRLEQQMAGAAVERQAQRRSYSKNEEEGVPLSDRDEEAGKARWEAAGACPPHAQPAAAVAEAMDGSHVGPDLLPPRERFMLRLAYPLLVGLIASWTVLLVKCCGSLVRHSAIDGGATWGRYQAWLMLLGPGITIPTQLTYLNRALARFEALFVVPSLQCCMPRRETNQQISIDAIRPNGRLPLPLCSLVSLVDYNGRPLLPGKDG